MREGMGRAMTVRQAGALRVPLITAWFWVIKGLSTAMGESTSDYLVHRFDPPVAVVIGFVLFAIALGLQLTRHRYWAWTYWFAVVGVGVFGTMAADVVHVGLGVPYAVSVTLGIVAMAAVFVAWARTEGTLSIHSIDTTRRELFYWATVVVTFALGTAVGDFTAVTLGLGYLASAVLFGVLILVPALGYRFLGWNAILCFWAAYVLTRPLGASVADWMGKTPSDGGLGWGAGLVSVVLTVLIVACVAVVAITKSDVQAEPGETASIPSSGTDPVSRPTPSG
jgi:uncharacterized membrane-anchored protein